MEHTADHVDRNSNNDVLENLRWLCKKGQRNNQDRQNTYKSTIIVVKDGKEKTIKEWIEYLKDEKNSLGRDYTESMITGYAQKKKHGYAYKEYPDLLDENWKKIVGSDNKIGHWEISDMNRVRYITKYKTNIISGKRHRLSNGYPTISINGKQWPCHILSFMTFFPDEYNAKNPEDIILHENDNKLDFRPHKLRLGTRSENIEDAYANGCYDGKKSARKKCISYIDGVLEKEHESQGSAVRYLKTIGYSKAIVSAIYMVLNGTRKTAYDRAWILSS
jgi:hypothetical protein